MCFLDCSYLQNLDLHAFATNADAAQGRHLETTDLSFDGIDVYVEGGTLFKDDFLCALKSDLAFVVGSVFFILVYISVHVRSVRKALAAVLMMTLSFAPVLFFYRVVMGHKEMGILNFVTSQFFVWFRVHYACITIECHKTHQRLYVCVVSSSC